MIISSQDRGEKIEDVIGKDYKEFCDNIIENLEPKTIKEKIINFLYVFCGGVSILLLIKIVMSIETILMIKDLINGKTPDLNISFSPQDITIIIFIMIVVTAFVFFIMKNSFKVREKTKISNLVILVYGFLIIFGVLTLFIPFGKGTSIFSVNIFIALLFAILLFFVHKILDRI